MTPPVTMKERSSSVGNRNGRRRSWNTGPAKKGAPYCECPIICPSVNDITTPRKRRTTLCKRAGGLALVTRQLAPNLLCRCRGQMRFLIRGGRANRRVGHRWVRDCKAQLLALKITVGGCVYSLALLLLWGVAGRPDGPERMGAGLAKKLLTRIRRARAA